jgi:RNA polymerase sigma-70 factor, ECF subfamily
MLEPSAQNLGANSGDPVSAETVARARRGDPAAFEAVVRSFDAGLRLLAHRILGAAWTEDALQEAYVRAFRAFPNFVPEQGSVGGWLYRIVYRTSIDELRRSKRRTSISSPMVEELEGDSAPDHRVLQRVSVWNALALLAPEERATVVLVDALGFDYDSAASILEIPRGTVASRLNRARPLIRDALADDQEESK